MKKLQPSLMEVTRALSDCAREAGFDFGEDTAIVAVQHMLWQTVDLFEAVVALGVKRENIFALGKVYSNSPVVIGTLRDQGVNVLQSTIPQPGEFDRCFQLDVNELWQLVSRKLVSRNIKRILILDDGGTCITTVPRELLNRYSICGVEQTSFGMFLFEVEPPPFAVMSWARTAVKLQVGGPIFSHCLLVKLENRILSGQTLREKNLGILGLGSIGSSLANLAARQDNNVIFYDPDPLLQIPSCLRGRVTRVESLDELMLRCEYVFGCSGRQPFRDHDLPKYRPGIRLFSASGGDHEFGPIIDDLKLRSGFSVAQFTWDISCDDGSSGPISIAYLGYPYNFVARDIEAVPIGIVQIETSGLLAGLIQARIHLSLCERGRIRNSGIHRISPEAQRFVYKTWLTAMKGRRISLTPVYGCDPAMLRAARDQWWFSENSEPHPSLLYEPNHAVEEAMASMVDEPAPSHVGFERELQPNLCSI
ncbi:MAG TPA: NAD(P)-dependent oxidoreductase [Pyrinomonadaceae bacterium]|jgi:hypothetical protein